MSGVEIVGLILGSLPLLIAGLELYGKGVKSIKQFVQYERLLNRLTQQLDMEYTHFHDSCSIMLHEVVATPEAKLLLERARSDRWKDKQLQAKLEERLGVAGWRAFRGAMIDMDDVVQEFKEDLELDVNYEVKWINAKVYKREWKRLLLAMSVKEYGKLLDRMDKHNRDFRTLLGQGTQLQAMRRIENTKHAKMYGCVMSQAKALHAALRKVFTQPCGCVVPHRASLLLQPRTTPMNEASDESVGPFVFLFYFDEHPRVVIQPPWNWRETVIRMSPRENRPIHQPQFSSSSPSSDNLSVSTTTTVASRHSGRVASLKSTSKSISFASILPRRSVNQTAASARVPSPSAVASTPSLNGASSQPTTMTAAALTTTSAAQTIEDLCRTINSAPRDIAELGVLVDDDEKRHHVSISDGVFFPRAPTNVVTLAAMLKMQSCEMRDRLVLGINLASAVLQLCGTPWLRDRWSKADIYFADPVTQGISRPVVCKTFSPPTCTLASARTMTDPISKPSLAVRNMTIFALGIVLIELWYWKPFEEMRLPEDLGGASDPSPITDFATASRLSEKIYQDAAKAYGHAVRRCIFCVFDQQHVDLKHESFREAVHRGVVDPLKANLDFFNGGAVDGLLT